MIRSIFCASPGRRNECRNRRIAMSKSRKAKSSPLQKALRIAVDRSPLRTDEWMDAPANTTHSERSEIAPHMFERWSVSSRETSGKRSKLSDEIRRARAHTQPKNRQPTDRQAVHQALACSHRAPAEIEQYPRRCPAEDLFRSRT
jgi:hypothetical protein